MAKSYISREYKQCQQWNFNDKKSVITEGCFQVSVKNGVYGPLRAASGARKSCKHLEHAARIES